MQTTYAVRGARPRRYPTLQAPAKRKTADATLDPRGVRLRRSARRSAVLRSTRSLSQNGRRVGVSAAPWTARRADQSARIRRFSFSCPARRPWCFVSRRQRDPCRGLKERYNSDLFAPLLVDSWRLKSSFFHGDGLRTLDWQSDGRVMFVLSPAQDL